MAPLPVVRRNTIPIVYDRFALVSDVIGLESVGLHLLVKVFDCRSIIDPGKIEPPPPEFKNLPEARSKARYLWAIFWAWIGISAVYVMLKPSKEEVWPPGFYDLLDCTYVVSLDGTKELDLFANQRAVFYDKSVKENGKYRTVEGNWTFYEATKLYAVIFNGEVTTYAIAKPTGVCILVKGDLGAADLRGSWFSSVSNEDDRERPDPY